MTRTAKLLAFAAFILPIAATPVLGQQDTTRDSGSVHKALKGAGRETKSGVKSLGSKIHHTLKKAGHDTKAAIDRATGDTIPHKPHKPGGLNKVARDVSGAVKHVGRSTKSGLKKTSSKTHRTLKKTGRDVKAGLKNPDTTTQSQR